MAKKLTQEEFLADITKRLGETIDFSKSIYVNDNTPIECKCKKCGKTWFPTPNNLKQGRGCPQCNHKSSRYTLDEWQELVKKRHGDKYDLSLVTEYKSRNQILDIICHEKFKDGSEHGVFQITSASFLNGHGCPHCAKNVRKEKETKPFEQMVEDAKNVHGDKYIYDKETYVNAHVKMKITCPIHGEFWQTPHAHINKKRGCPKCNGGVKLTQEEYLEKIKDIYKNTFDLSQIKYTNANGIVTPICPKHGLFEIKARNFAKGHGCPMCAKEKNKNSLTYTQEKVIEMAKQVHGDRYNYDNSKYVNMLTPMAITCPIHGEFWQMPNKHIHMKQGCPKCNESKLEKEIGEYLSENNIESEQGKRFKWLGLQHLDFYLPQYNIAIECQGEQHYKPTRFGSNNDEKFLEKIFISQQQRDQRKKQLCEENGVKLLYYTTYKNVKEDEITFKNKEKILDFIYKHEKVS